GIDLGDYFGTGYLTWLGKLQGMPFDHSPWVYYYNKNVIEKAGVEDPASLYKKGQFTTDKFLEMAAKITRGEGKDKVFAMRAGNPSLTVMCAWIFGFNGKIFSDDYKTVQLTDPNTIKAIQYLADWSLKGYAPGDAELQGIQNGLVGLFN